MSASGEDAILSFRAQVQSGGGNCLPLPFVVTVGTQAHGEVHWQNVVSVLGCDVGERADADASSSISPAVRSPSVIANWMSVVVTKIAKQNPAVLFFATCKLANKKWSPFAVVFTGSIVEKAARDAHFSSVSESLTRLFGEEVSVLCVV